MYIRFQQRKYLSSDGMSHENHHKQITLFKMMILITMHYLFENGGSIKYRWDEIIIFSKDYL